jgi:alpha,alpha-trehalase
VPGFAGLTVERLRDWFAGREHARPNALAEWARLARELAGATPAVFLDYDGTLTPIAARPDLATLDEPMRATLRRLARACAVAVVSGRARPDVEALVAIPEIDYAGSHGLDIAGPRAGRGIHLPAAEQLVPAVAAAAREIRKRTAAIPGVLVEDKTYALAVHYRLVDPPLVPEVERAVDEALGRHAGLVKTGGKMVFELRPAIDWDKGRAVLWLLDTLGLERGDVRPLYIGDDVTDEDAFRSLADRGIGILVAELPRPTGARYSLQDVHEVRALLDRIAARAEREER